MRSNVEIRDRLLGELSWAVTRPGMAGGDARGAQVILNHLLRALCFIEQREEELQAVSGEFLWGCRGVYGQFDYRWHPTPSFANEIASVYAAAAYRLGLFQPARLLSEADMSRLAKTVRKAAFFRRDWTEAELHEQFGPPSHEVVGGYTTVACYAGESPTARWVFFDLARQAPGSEAWLPSPLLRDFRDRPDNRLHLLPFGRRWVQCVTLNPPDGRPAVDAS